MKRTKDDDLRDEIAGHLEMATADRVARGESPADAAAAARKQLGNIPQIQEATRDVWGRRWIEYAVQDLRYALRTFRRNPGFATVAILSLALGIGANTALFEVVNAVRLRPLAIADPGGLYQVRLSSPDGMRGNFQTEHPAVTQPIWREVFARQQAFTGLFAWSRAGFNLAEGGESLPAEGLWVSGEFFNTLGLRPAAGRLLSPEDDRPGCAPRAVLGEGFWRRAFGGDPLVAGRMLTLSGRPVEIIGVAPAGFHGLDVGRTFDVALPLCAEPVFSVDGKGRLNAGTTWWLGMFGRLAPGWTEDRAKAHLAAISPALFASTLPANYPAVSVSKYLAFTLTAEPGGQGLSRLRDAYVTPLWLLLGVAALVLVIACANLANLLLARASARGREISVRLGLGASRGRVIRQLITESAVLVAAGSGLAVFIAGGLGRWLVAALGTTDSAITLPLGADWRVLGFAALLAVATCLLFGLAPAIRGTRVAAASVLRPSARGTTAGRESVALRRSLVVVQIALSVALLFGSLLFARTLRNVMTIDPGFRPDGLVVADINSNRLALPAERLAAHQALMLDRIRAIPGVQGAAVVAIVPVSGNSGGNDVWPDGNRGEKFNTRVNHAGRGYFAALGVPLVGGRDFDERDVPQSPHVVVVNETFAGNLGGAAAAIGRRITREATPGSPEETYEIVGVVRNSTYETIKEKAYPVLFYADSQYEPERRPSVIVRSSLPPAAVASAVTAALTGIDRRIVVSYTVMPVMIHDALTQERVVAMLSGGFGALAVLLTVVGLYGLISYSVTRRTSEIGVRMALGAGRGDIVRLILRETGMLLACGVAIGAGLALAGGLTASSLLFGVRSYDPPTLLAAVGMLSAIALAASYVPARRATRIEPVAALRAD